MPPRATDNSQRAGAVQALQFHQIRRTAATPNHPNTPHMSSYQASVLSDNPEHPQGHIQELPEQTPANPNDATHRNTPGPSTPTHHSERHSLPPLQPAGSPFHVPFSPIPESPQVHPGNNIPQAQALDLANAIALLAGNVRQSQAPPRPKTNVREPDQFDGSDSKKLQPFLVQLQLTFRDRPDAFQYDENKVNFALSYLRGTALDFFEPSLMDPYAISDWASDYDVFVDTLKKHFGPFNAEADAENELDKLRMKENHKIAKYIVMFQQLAPRVQWGEAALQRQFYMGLPSRIKDEIARVGKPDSLVTLRNLSQSIDARYWERHSEIARETTVQNKSDKSSDKKSEKEKKKTNQQTNNSSNDDGNKSSNQQKQNANASGSSTSNQNTRKATPDISDKLGKDGKLTQAERQRRFDNNLCLFCGKGGHVARECSKANSSASKAKAHATKAEDESESAPAEDSKN